MGVGKSTTGRALAKHHRRDYVDSDVDIERLFGVDGNGFATQWGIGELHRVEAGVLLGALAATTPTVITAAASVVESEIVRAALKRRAFVVWLTADLETVLARQAAGTHRRPMSIVELDDLAQRRRPFFQDVADVTVEATLPTREIVEVASAAFDAYITQGKTQ